MAAEHILNPSDEDAKKRISRGEMALHCRRTTGGVAETTSLIAYLAEAIDGEKGHDTLGVPLINGERMREIWAVKSKHVPCIEDPSGTSLYAQSGSLAKEGWTLPTNRCARGSKSLESFHLHLSKFIPGQYFITLWERSYDQMPLSSRLVWLIAWQDGIKTGPGLGNQLLAVKVVFFVAQSTDSQRLSWEEPLSLHTQVPGNTQVSWHQC